MPEPTHTRPRSILDDNRVYAAVLSVIFLTAATFNVSHHAMWRDETRAWQIAAASPTLAALRQNLHYEGVPMLWYLILWPLTKITLNPLAMQLAHVVIATGVVFTFSIAAPFGRLIKTLFAFGYFPFFEYATISRNYGLVFLFFLIAAALISAPKPRPIFLAIVVALLAQVSIWGIGFAMLMMFIAAMEWGVRFRTRLRLREIFAVAIVMGSCILAYAESIPGPGSSYIITWVPGSSSWEKFMGSVGTVWKGWMPLPLWQRVWWNTNVLDDYYFTHFICACFLLAIAVFCLLRRPIAMLLLVIGLCAQMAFTYFKFCGFTRHHGQLFMVLIVACWIAARSPQWISKSKFLNGFTSWFDQCRNLLLGLLLLIHTIVGISANTADAVLPFSAGKAVAEYIRDKQPADATLVGVDDYTMSPISTYLHREFYFPQMGKFAPFNTQDDAERFEVTPQMAFDDIRNLIARDGHDVIFLRSQAMSLGPEVFDLTFPPSGDLPRMVVRVTLLEQFTDSTVPDEMQSVYLFHRIE
jgi:hypothetical protein